MPSFNYTNRRRLQREQTRIRLSPNADGKPRTFAAELDLPDQLPPDARVFVEAYRSSPAARMRFDFGTVGNPRPPADAALRDFLGDPRPPLFRVKVTDVSDRPGRLLADATQIKPVDPDEKPENKRGILYTVWANNDGLVWKLDLDYSQGPRLTIDQTADPYHELPGRKEFRALVYPELVRQVLTYILLQEPESLEDDQGWPRQWLTFPRQMFGFADNPPHADDDEERKRDWIEDAVRCCAKQAEFCRLLAPPPEDAPENPS